MTHFKKSNLSLPLSLASKMSKNASVNANYLYKNTAGISAVCQTSRIRLDNNVGRPTVLGDMTDAFV